MLNVTPPFANDDPRRLRELVERAAVLADQHALTSVMVGIVGRDGDPDFPEVLEFIESELRVEDSIFRLTRERAVLFVSDVDRAGAEEILDRLLQGYLERSCRVEPPQVSLRYFEIVPRGERPTVKHVLPRLFGAEETTH